MAAIFVQSSISDIRIPGNAPDKVAHALGYVPLAVMFVRALAGGLPARVTARQAVTACALTIAYGASDELHQLFVVGRTADVADLAADATGAAAAVAVCWAWGKIWRRPDV
jgi:VanZ family protein